MNDNKGRLGMPLYHGTSSFFLSQIREHGLGGYRDSQLFNLEILKSLAQALDDTRNPTEWWELNSLIVEPMINQRVTNGGFNFRYGGTYLSPSRSTACRYATSNSLGSEFLTVVFQAYMALAAVNRVEAERIVPNSHCLQAVFQDRHRPVLITLEDVSADKLKTERGEPIDKQLELMASMCNAGAGLEPDVLWQQFNFELEGAIDWHCLDITILDEKPVDSVQG